MELRGKTVIVTGSARRLGRAFALALAGEGARLLLHYGSSEAEARQTRAEVEAAGAEAQLARADFTRSGEAVRLVEEALAAFGRVDILINSAAIFEAGSFLGTDEASWDRHFSINLKSLFFLSQAFARATSAEGGKIVNIIDWRALRPGTDHVAYTLTKAAVNSLTTIMAQSLAPAITVNGLALGAILPPPGADAAHMEALARRIPLRRTGGPEDAIAGLLFLLKGSDFVTGTTIVIDGGEHL